VTRVGWMGWPHPLVFGARVACCRLLDMSWDWPHRLAFGAKVGPVGCVMWDGLAPPTRV
jgi:hypothetical protein